MPELLKPELPLLRRIMQGVAYRSGDRARELRLADLGRGQGK